MRTKRYGIISIVFAFAGVGLLSIGIGSPTSFFDLAFFARELIFYAALAFAVVFALIALVYKKRESATDPSDVRIGVLLARVSLVIVIGCAYVFFPVLNVPGQFTPPF